MSRPRVSTGTDDRGRPKAAWADPEPDRARGYGHMEPAYDATSVQRRKATPEELAAARAREDEPRHLTVRSGWDSTPATVPGKPADATRTPVIVEEAVSEEHANIPENIPDEAPATVIHVPTAAPIWTRQTEPIEQTLSILADAVAAAADAWLAKLQSDHLADQADIVWQSARAALDAAYRALDEPPEVVAETEPDPDHEAAKANLIRALRDAQASADAAKATEDQIPELPVEPMPIGGGPAKAKRPYTRPRVADRPLTPRQEQLLAATVRLRGDRKAVAKEFGLKAHQTVDVVLDLAGRKGRLPMDLIPLLPARFAKYTGV